MTDTNNILEILFVLGFFDNFKIKLDIKGRKIIKKGNIKYVPKPYASLLIL